MVYIIHLLLLALLYYVFLYLLVMQIHTQLPIVYINLNYLWKFLIDLVYSTVTLFWYVFVVKLCVLCLIVVTHLILNQKNQIEISKDETKLKLI